MGKIRIKTIGIDEIEAEEKRKMRARRDAKKLAKKSKVEGVGLKGGERVAVVEGMSEKQMKKLDQKTSKQKPTDEKKSADKDKIEAKKKQKLKAKSKKKTRSKRYKQALKLIDRKKLYPISDALELAKKTSVTRFDGSIETHILLNPKMLDSGKKKGKKKEKPSYRSIMNFPHGTGKKVRVAIADEKLIDTVKSGTVDFDVLVAHPSMMSSLAKVARILGPKGLMPNPKNGTISNTPEKIAEKLSKGQVTIKTEPDNTIVHIAIGKVSFETQKLVDNLNTLISEVGKSKIASISLSSTMGPGIKVDVESL